MWLFAVCFRYYHVIFNLMIQLLLGIPLEMVHKGVRIGIVYILGVIAGNENMLVRWVNLFLKIH